MGGGFLQSRLLPKPTSPAVETACFVCSDEPFGKGGGLIHLSTAGRCRFCNGNRSCVSVEGMGTKQKPDCRKEMCAGPLRPGAYTGAPLPKGEARGGHGAAGKECGRDTEAPLPMHDTNPVGEGQCPCRCRAPTPRGRVSRLFFQDLFTKLYIFFFTAVL